MVVVKKLNAVNTVRAPEKSSNMHSLSDLDKSVKIKKKRRSREEMERVTLDGFKFGQTEGYVEVWQKEVLKGIFAKRGKCIFPMKTEKGCDTICGKIFEKVPNCRRHMLVHKKIASADQMKEIEISQQSPAKKPKIVITEKKETKNLKKKKKIHATVPSSSSSSKYQLKNPMIDLNDDKEIDSEDSNSPVLFKQDALPMTDWVQCDHCKKWRRTLRTEEEPQQWFCSMNSDPFYNSCDNEQELPNWEIDKELDLHVVYVQAPEEILSTKLEPVDDIWVHDMEKEFTQFEFDKLYQSLFDSNIADFM
jgi:hypothetical protein